MINDTPMPDGSTTPAASARSLGPLRSVEALLPGDHVCWAVRSEREHRQVLTRYFGAGLQAGDRLAYFAARYSPEVVLGYLESAGYDPAALLASGRLVVLDAREAYAPDGTFDAARIVEAFADAARQARQDGFRALRAAGETDWVLPELVGLADLAAYELRCDLMAAGAPLIGLCLYDLRHCDPADVAVVAAVHAARVADADVSFCLHASAPTSLALAGEVDVADEDAFRAALAAALRVSGDPVVLDLSRLQFVDVRGMAALAALGRSGRPVRLTGAGDVLRTCWHLLGLGRPGNVVLA